MKKTLRILFTATLFLGMVLPVRGEVISKIAAVVNDDIITTYQLEKEIAAQLAAEPRGRSLPESENQRLRQTVLTGMVEDALVRQRVRELGLRVGEEEIDAAIEDVEKQNQITREQLIRALQAQGMSYSAYREKLRQQILRFKLIGREVQNKVEVTSQEIRDYFKENIDDYRGDSAIRLSYLAFRIPQDASVTNTQVSRLRDTAREAHELLRTGEEFYSTVFIYSTDPQVEGGELGTFTRAELNPAFKNAVKDLPVGGISEVVENPEGFYIFKVEERSKGEIRKFDTVKDEIREHLLEKDREERFKQWRTGLKKDAYLDVRI